MKNDEGAMNETMNETMKVMNKDWFINKTMMIVIDVKVDYICILKLITKYFELWKLIHLKTWMFGKSRDNWF